MLRKSKRMKMDHVMMKKHGYLSRSMYSLLSWVEGMPFEDEETDYYDCASVESSDTTRIANHLCF